MDKGYTFTINEAVKAQLNEHQQLFLELAFNRMYTIEKAINVEDTPATIRLLYLKEFYTIFSELENIKFDRQYIREQTQEEIDRINNIKSIVTFVRHILSHFPLFDTWDDIWISRDFTEKLGSKKGKIYKFLTPDKPREPIALRITFTGDPEPKTFQIFYPDNLKNDEKVYLKDIIAEDMGATAILALIKHLYWMK